MDTQTVTFAPRKRTRAEAIRGKVRIDLALDEHGPAIAAVLKANGIDVSFMDWSKVFPYWLVAMTEGRVIGCCQILVAKPVGYVEFLFTDPREKFKVRMVAAQKLIDQSMQTLSMAGAQVVGGVVATENRKFSDVLTKRAFVKAFPAEMFVKRLK